MPTMAFRMARPAHLIDINRIEELQEVKVIEGTLCIGACVRHAYFENNNVPGALGRLLRNIVRHIAHYPIRCRGTFCGSIANADPASEWCCTTVAMDGTIVARSTRGIRRIAAKDYYRGVLATDLKEDEMVVQVELPLIKDDTHGGIRRIQPSGGELCHCNGGCDVPCRARLRGGQQDRRGRCGRRAKTYQGS